MEPKLFLTDIAIIEDCTLPTIHQRIKYKNLEALKHKSKSYLPPEMARMIIKKDIIKQNIAIHTTKGGVGKTTITLNLAYRLWTFGVRILVIDLDQQANLTKGFKKNDPQNYVIQDVIDEKCTFEQTIIKVKDGLDLIPSSLKNARNSQSLFSHNIYPGDFLPNHIQRVSKNYDMILIDCPPSLGNVIESAYMASDRVLSVLDPDDNALDGVVHSQQEVQRLNDQKKLNIKFNILLNKYDSRTVFSNSILDVLFKNPLFKKSTLNTVVNTSQDFLKLKSINETIFDNNKKTKSFIDIDNLAREILGWPTGGHNG